MKQITVTLNVDENSVLSQSKQHNLNDAIFQELTWLHDSGIFVEKWSYTKEEKAHDVQTSDVEQTSLSANEIEDISSDLPLSERLKNAAKTTDRFIRINGQDISFDALAKALGIPESNSFEVHLCQRVADGILVAKGASFDNDDYPGIDLELELPPEKKSLPVMISRTEQSVLDAEDHGLRTFGYNREGEYFMYFDSDVRPDALADRDMKDTKAVISGSPTDHVQVYRENQYVCYNGELVIEKQASVVNASERSQIPFSGTTKPGLNTLIQSAALKRADNQPDEVKSSHKEATL